MSTGSASPEIRWGNNREASLAFREGRMGKGRRGGVGVGWGGGLTRCRRVFFFLRETQRSVRESWQLSRQGSQILRRDGGRATLMVRKDVTIRKVGAAGSAEHNLSTASLISLHKPELMLVFDHRL